MRIWMAFGIDNDGTEDFVAASKKGRFDALRRYLWRLAVDSEREPAWYSYRRRLSLAVRIFDTETLEFDGGSPLPAEFSHRLPKPFSLGIDR